MRLLRLFLLGLLLAAPAAQASTGRLDTRFSGDGLAKLTHDHGTIPVAVAAAPQGGLYVAVEGRFAVLRMRASGRLETRFGRGGVATVARTPTWDGNASVQALAVRPGDGAVFLAGRGRGDLLVVAGFDRSGRPLAGFGTGGVAELPMHAFSWGAAHLLVDPGGLTWAALRAPSGSGWWGPLSELTWLRFDAAGRVGALSTRALSRSATPELALWRTDTGATRALVAGDPALYELGAPAPLVSPRPPAAAGRLVTPIGGDLLVLDPGTYPASPSLLRIGGRGTGPVRWSRALGRRFGVAESVVPDRRGGAYVAGRATRGAGTSRYQRVIAVMHVRSGGGVDRAFGRHGVLDVHLAGHNRFISTPRLLFDRQRHRLWLAADAGSGFFDIREDFGGHDVVVARIRTR